MPSDSGRDAVAQYLDDLLWVAREEPLPLPVEQPRMVAVAHSPLSLQQDQTINVCEQPPKPAPAKSTPVASTSVALEDGAKTRLQALLDREFLPRLVEAAPLLEALTEPQEADITSEKSEIAGAAPTPMESAEVHTNPAVTEDPLEELEAGTLVQWLPNGRPAWAQTRFDVLLLVVSGLVIAVPLVVLGQIYPLGQGIHQVPGQANWSMGVLNTRRGPVNILNTARYIMAERYQAEFVESAKYLVTLANSPWGLAVDAIRQPVSLDPEDVVWRQAGGQRPWLAGTVKSHLCALLDIPQLAELLRGAQARK